MYISSNQTPSSNRIEVTKLREVTRDGWEYMIEFGYSTRIIVSRAEMLDLEQRLIRHLADAWADEADNVQR